MNDDSFCYERNGVCIDCRILFFCTFPLVVLCGKEIQLYAFIVDLFETRNEVRVQILFIENHKDVIVLVIFGNIQAYLLRVLFLGEISLKRFTRSFAPERLFL